MRTNVQIIHMKFCKCCKAFSFCFFFFLRGKCNFNFSGIFLLVLFCSFAF
uniref:Uncharacterized protein n=1 Tax=Nelumbo nucifera TaxID=4432 RepID=A0A822YDM6_NELNU|nr:TPA_asm: hypothetical protein HUJ06_030543 [Nelumbo nucifera]